MKLTEYLDGMRAAATADEMEAAIQADHKHPFIGRTWSRICKVRIEVGERICAAHPNGYYVPRFGPRRRLTVCGETFRVGAGGNSAGVRWAWANAEDRARDILVDAHGFSKRAFHAIWGTAFDYPHRSLKAVERALADDLPDPELNVLTRLRDQFDGKGVRVDRAGDEAERRSHRPCPCDQDGWLWDWGGGWIGYAYHVNWYCDQCPAVFGEYAADLSHRRRSTEAAP